MLQSTLLMISTTTSDIELTAANYFCKQCVQRFLIETAATSYQGDLQNGSCRSYISFPKSTHMIYQGWIPFPFNSICNLLCRKASSLFWLNSSTVLANSFSAPMKVFRFSHLMDLTRSFLPIKYLKTSMNDSVSMLCCHFHIDCLTYQRSEKYSITLQGVSSFLQVKWTKYAHSAINEWWFLIYFNLSKGRFTMICLPVLTRNLLHLC